MHSIKSSGYLNHRGSVPTRSQQQQIIQEHKLKQTDKQNISAIKISMTFIALFMVVAVILS